MANVEENRRGTASHGEDQCEVPPPCSLPHPPQATVAQWAKIVVALADLIAVVRQVEASSGDRGVRRLREGFASALTLAEELSEED